MQSAIQYSHICTLAHPHISLAVYTIPITNFVNEETLSMCVFNDYIRKQEELKEMQKEIIIVSKNYNNELRIFQKGNIIDSYNAEKVKQKYDEMQEANKRIATKQQDLENTAREIQEYLNAMNGMAIRYTDNYQGLNQEIIFDMEIDNYGEPKIKMAIAD